MILLILLLGSGVFYLLGPTAAARVRSLTNVVLVPFGDGGMEITTAVRSAWGGVELPGGGRLTPGRVQRLIEENITLRGQVETLESRYEQLRAERREVDELYDRWPGFDCAVIPARVVAAGSLPYGASRLLNVGTSKGVGPGSPVTTRGILTDRAKAIPLGLAAVSRSAMVGRIVSSGPFCARLRLVTDRDYTIHAQIVRIIDPDRPREVMVTVDGETVLRPLTEAINDPIDVQARGDGADGMRIEEFSADHKVRAGDWLMTRREDPLFPVRIRIGMVTEVRADASKPHFVTARVRPHADLDTLRRVYVVVPLAGWAAAG